MIGICEYVYEYTSQCPFRSNWQDILWTSGYVFHHASSYPYSHHESVCVYIQHTEPRGSDTVTPSSLILNSSLCVSICVYVSSEVYSCLTNWIAGPSLVKDRAGGYSGLKRGDQMAGVRPWASGLTPSVWSSRLPVIEPDPPAKPSSRG